VEDVCVSICVRHWSCSGSQHLSVSHTWRDICPLSKMTRVSLLVSRGLAAQAFFLEAVAR
jgi:hypothetical protein